MPGRASSARDSGEGSPPPLRLGPSAPLRAGVAVYGSTVDEPGLGFAVSPVDGALLRRPGTLCPAESARRETLGKGVALRFGLASWLRSGRVGSRYGAASEESGFGLAASPVDGALLRRPGTLCPAESARRETLGKGIALRFGLASWLRSGRASPSTGRRSMNQAWDWRSAPLTGRCSVGRALYARPAHFGAHPWGGEPPAPGPSPADSRGPEDRVTMFQRWLRAATNRKPQPMRREYGSPQ
jgi:hypothetical protein